MLPLLSRTPLRSLPASSWWAPQRYLHGSRVNVAPVEIDPSRPMWQYQKSLPRFPLPALDDTLDKYKTALKALLPEAEFNKYEEKVEAFRKNEGPVIHAELAHVEERATNNWMEGYWQSMYEKLRCALPINVSPYLVLGPDPNPLQNKDQILKAASHIAAAARFTVKQRAQALTPDGTPETPMCMFQFTRMLGTTRIPEPSRDRLRVVDDSRHIIVASMNNFYKLNVLDEAGSPVPVQEIIDGLCAIKKHSQTLLSSQSHLFPVGILTTEDRNVWAGVRTELVQDQLNAASLNSIEEGIMVVCLEDNVTKDPSDIHKISLFGNGNRFFDKCLQLIVTENGEAAYNLEHTPIDGQTLFRFIYDTYNDATSSVVSDVEPSLTATNFRAPDHLAFNLSPSIQQSISNASLSYNQFVSAVDISVLEFNDFGKSDIKTFKVSPDAFVQFCAQVAQYRTTGNLVSTYESSSTKHFSHGRTETIRSLTAEMKDAVLTFENPSASVQEKIDAIRAASSQHGAVAKASKTGEGIDRHLQGLNWTAQQMLEREGDFEMPDFFLDNTYSEFMSNKLSTSNVGGGFVGVRSFGFGAVHAEGVGLGYMINNDSLPLTLTSYTGIASKWTDNLSAALKEAHALFSSEEK